MGRGRKVAIIVAIVLSVTGVCILAFPFLEGALYDRHVASLEDEFLHRVQDTESASGTDNSNGYSTDFEGLYRYLMAENERLYREGQSGLVDAFSYQQPGVDLSNWGVYDNLIGFVSIPSIGSNMPIYLGANTEQMDKGAVHLTQTSYPIGGINSNSVIAAHRGTFSGLPMLRNIDGIQVGDEVIITNFREALHYRACEIKIIQPNEIDQVLIQDGRDLITLITCNPLWDNYERYVVYCERTDG